MGCYFGSEEVMAGAAPDNPKGFWERTDVIKINEDILAAAGGNWWDVNRLDFSRISAEESAWFNKRIGGIALKLDAHRPWFIKDPRLCLTLNFWLPFLERPVFIHVTRSPVQIAKSLQRRNGIPLEYGLALWEFYTVSMYRILGKQKCIPISYEQLLQEPFDASTRIYNLMKSEGVEGMSQPVRLDVESFVEPSLCHFYDGEERNLLSPSQRSLLDTLGEGKPVAVPPNFMDVLAKTMLRMKNEGEWAQKLSSPANVELPEERLEKLEARNIELEARNGELEARNVELAQHLKNISRSRLVRGMVKGCRIVGVESCGLSAELYRIEHLLGCSREEEYSAQHVKAGWFVMTLRLVGFAVANPRLALQLLHPRRLKNALILLVKNRGNLQQLFNRYQEISCSLQDDAKESDEFLARARMAGGKGDVFIFPVIDWHFRHQRPQHLALELGKRGYRVFYFSTKPLMSQCGAPFRLISQPGENIFVCSLRARSQKMDNIYKERMGDEARDAYLRSMSSLMAEMGIRASVSLIDHSYWKPLADVIPGTVIGYDCMDHHIGFHEESIDIPEAEAELIRDADFVVTSSVYLHDNVGRIRQNTLIRNGCEYAFFVAEGDHFPGDGRPVVGYVGAIATWFDIDLVIAAALGYPDWRFVLVGSTLNCDTGRAKDVKNIEFIGEVPYEHVPYYLRGFDVCIIPFRLCELTKATNPVKIYEYLSAGKPVVSTALPEVLLLEDKVLVGRDPEEFIVRLREAMEAKEDPSRISGWREWASQQDWSLRACKLEESILAAQPLVSIIVLTYNNLALTKACLDTIESNTFYANYEVIIVDNLSTDGSRDYLKTVVQEKGNWTLILNEQNLGFAAGNNVGMRAANGEYVVLLNNDTQVVPGWLKNLIRPFATHRKLGLAGPVTNNIGNEAKIDISYRDKEEMIERARQYMTKNNRKLLFVGNVAFFCVAMSRRIIDEVGLLDEQFGIGFFEDDDYCHRVKKAGYDIAIVEDSFVHHHLSASFDKMGAKRRQRLFEENKRLFEAKWGEWRPHSYR
jgi:hypothetical protein